MNQYHIPVSNDDLHEFCINYELFTSGSNEQFKKLFAMNEAGASIDAMAAAVWVCSDGCSYQEVLELMHREFAWTVNTARITAVLKAAGIDTTTTAIVSEALRTHQDEGSCYQIQS